MRLLLLVALLSAGASIPRDKDKSKPVRAALNARYAELADAYRRHDMDAVMAMRAPDFFAVQASGARWDRSAVEAYTRAAFAQVETTLVMTNDLDVIDVHGDTADAAVAQHWVRRQQKAGAARLVDTRARQHETWVRKGSSWMLWRVDRVQPGEWIVDGKRIDPSKRYDPDAKPFE